MRRCNLSDSSEDELSQLELLRQELEQYRPLAIQAGASKAISDYNQLVAEHVRYREALENASTMLYDGKPASMIVLMIHKALEKRTS